MQTDNNLIQVLCRFVSHIGIAIHEKELPDTTFLPGLLIDQGKLFIDSRKLLYPGDILHEAGHIAVTLPDQRSSLSGNITDNQLGKEGDEVAVLLWTYAAYLHIGISPEIVFHPAGYKGEGDWLINQFTAGNYTGLPLLVWMGFTNPADSGLIKGFPAMKTWLRETPKR